MYGSTLLPDFVTTGYTIVFIVIVVPNVIILTKV